MQKRVVTIQDISCLGNCSLTVALPIISALGIETCVVPTAVLSTHTMFTEFTFRDLTEDLPSIKDHWHKQGFKFDALYSGYLGSDKQLEYVADYFDTFGKEGLIVVDPVMADNGKLYPGFSLDFARKMAKLCGKADVIVPNLTEACFMLGEQYIESGYDENYIKNILVKLADLGCKTAMLTGVSFQKGKIGVMGYNKSNDEFFCYFNDRIDAAFHGTGDIFSSTLVGCLVGGKSLLDSSRIAADYTAKCIAATAYAPDHINYGVYFEPLLGELIDMAK